MPTGRPRFAFLGLGVPTDWVTHRIAVEFTTLWGIDHGRTLSIIQPWLLRETLAAKREKLEQMGRMVFGHNDPSAETPDAAGRIWQAVQTHGNAAFGTHAEIDAEKAERIIRAACGG